MNAFGNYAIRSIDTLGDSLHDQNLKSVMDANGLRELIVSDGCYYPIVRRLDRKIKVKRYEVLDPYTDYRTTCSARIAGRAGESLPDGWRIHIEGGNRSPEPTRTG